MDGKEKVERWLDGFSVFIKPEDLCCFTSELKITSLTSSENADSYATKSSYFNKISECEE